MIPVNVLLYSTPFRFVSLSATFGSHMTSENGRWQFLSNLEAFSFSSIHPTAVTVRLIPYQKLVGATLEMTSAACPVFEVSLLF